MKFSTRALTRGGIISALYIVLTFVTLPIASGSIQFRLSEALTLLPLFFIESIPALTIGCALANLITGCALLDIVCGSLITLISAVLTYLFGKIIKNNFLKVVVGGFFPIILNAFLLPVVWYFAYGKLEIIYIFNVLSLFVSQSASIYGAGAILYLSIQKLMKTHSKLFE